MRLGKHLPLLVFPAAEIVFFALAVSCLQNRPVAAMLGVFFAGLALSFSVHICFHEMVHATGEKNSPALVVGSCAATLLQGMPFDGYRRHHENHHLRGNGPEDYSTTWEAGPEGLKPQTWWRYAFLWPKQLENAHADLRKLAESGRLPRWVQRRIRGEKWLLISAMIGLGLFSWKALALYALTVYWGWTLVALHNYGQHPPVDPREATKSYANPIYNTAFFNNGLHYEHHDRPRIPWYALTQNPAAPQIGLPHIIGFIAARSHDG